MNHTDQRNHPVNRNIHLVTQAPSTPANDSHNSIRDAIIALSHKKKIILALIALLSAAINAGISSGISAGADIYREKMEIAHEDAVRVQENSYVQEFISTSEAVDIATIPYVNYEITSDPDLPGFDVYPYSYIKYTTEMGTKYLFLENQFTQIQYTTDKNGVCRMKRENTTGDLEALITSAYMQAYPDKQISVSSGCIVAIQYSSDRDLFVSLFELTNGNLPKVTDEELLNAITDYNNNPKGIDMTSFPHNTENIISFLF